VIKLGVTRKRQSHTLYIGEIGTPARTAYDSWHRKNIGGSFSNYMNRLLIAAQLNNPDFKSEKIKGLLHMRQLLVSESKKIGTDLKILNVELEAQGVDPYV